MRGLADERVKSGEYKMRRDGSTIPLIRYSRYDVGGRDGRGKKEERSRRQEKEFLRG